MDCRWLADFQVDKHRQCVLHKIRGKRIKSLLDELRQHHATALVRPLQLDAGSAYREIADIKYEDGRAHDKVALGHLAEARRMPSPCNNFLRASCMSIGSVCCQSGT